MVIIKIAGGEGGQGLAVQTVGRGRSVFDDVAFIKLEFKAFMCYNLETDF